MVTLALAAAGCAPEPASQDADIVDVPYGPVELQGIGNCWVYATAAWAESLHLQRTGKVIDLSEAYWTYWDWYETILEGDGQHTSISTGGSFDTAGRIVRARGLALEGSFLGISGSNAFVERLKGARDRVDAELSAGRLASPEAQSNPTLVRRVLDDAFRLPSAVRALLGEVFGADGRRRLDDGSAQAEGIVIDGTAVPVRYKKRALWKTWTVDTHLVVATKEWSKVDYPNSSLLLSSVEERRRGFLQRVQRALHDRQPVPLSWAVDFNAFEREPGPYQGSFNLTTLQEAGSAGVQGEHLVTIEDYEAVVPGVGVVPAGVTLDPNDPQGAELLDRLLDDDVEIRFLRVKNSWGDQAGEASYAPGFPGYHDLYLDYLDGPIAWCPDRDEKKLEGSTAKTACSGSKVPLDHVALPPGY